MSEVRWMAGAAFGSWLAATAVVGTHSSGELLLGMLGPLAAVLVSWVIAERTYRASPERMTAVMIAAFAAKLVFFGTYVAVMLGVLAFRPVAFVASFTGHFIGLYSMEALYLHRLFTRGTD